jgi:hypothetical protein
MGLMFLAGTPLYTRYIHYNIDNQALKP